MRPTPEAPTGADLALLDPDGTFSVRLAQDRAALADLARGLGAGSPAVRDRALAAIEALAHRLAGAAGTFGHGAVGAAALALESDVIAVRKGADPEEGRETVERRLAGLLSALGQAVGPSSSAEGPQD